MNYKSSPFHRYCILALAITLGSCNNAEIINTDANASAIKQNTTSLNTKWTTDQLDGQWVSSCIDTSEINDNQVPYSKFIFEINTEENSLRTWIFLYDSFLHCNNGISKEYYSSSPNPIYNSNFLKLDQTFHNLAKNKNLFAHLSEDWGKTLLWGSPNSTNELHMLLSQADFLHAQYDSDSEYPYIYGLEHSEFSYAFEHILNQSYENLNTSFVTLNDTFNIKINRTENLNLEDYGQIEYFEPQ